MKKSMKVIPGLGGFQLPPEVLEKTSKEYFKERVGDLNEGGCLIVRAMDPKEIVNTLGRGQKRIVDNSGQHGGTEQYVSTSVLFPGMRMFGVGSVFLLVDYQAAEMDQGVVFSGHFKSNAGTYGMKGRGEANKKSDATSVPELAKILKANNSFKINSEVRMLGLNPAWVIGIGFLTTDGASDMPEQLKEILQKNLVGTSSTIGESYPIYSYPKNGVGHLICVDKAAVKGESYPTMGKVMGVFDPILHWEKALDKAAAAPALKTGSSGYTVSEISFRSKKGFLFTVGENLKKFLQLSAIPSIATSAIQPGFTCKRKTDSNPMSLGPFTGVRIYLPTLISDTPQAKSHFSPSSAGGRGFASVAAPQAADGPSAAATVQSYNPENFDDLAKLFMYLSHFQDNVIVESLRKSIMTVGVKYQKGSQTVHKTFSGFIEIEWLTFIQSCISPGVNRVGSAQGLTHSPEDSSNNVENFLLCLDRTSGLGGNTVTDLMGRLNSEEDKSMVINSSSLTTFVPKTAASRSASGGGLEEGSKTTSDEEKDRRCSIS